MGLRTLSSIAASGQVEPGRVTQFGALIAEFSGTCFAATRKVSVLRDVLVTELVTEFETPVRVKYNDHRIELTCECGSMIGWTHTVRDLDPFMYTYWDAGTEEGTAAPCPHLGLIRTTAAAPPCTHWHELPLRFPTAPVG